VVSGSELLRFIRGVTVKRRAGGNRVIGGDLWLVETSNCHAIYLLIPKARDERYYFRVSKSDVIQPKGNTT
jgi:hypothetical protein